MQIEFLQNGPAVLIEEEYRAFVVADLHMGIESDLMKHGIHLKQRGDERIKRLTNLIRESSPDYVLILGDIKHRVPGTSWQEFRELPDLFSAVRELAPMRITPGNHDPGIEVFLKEGELLPVDGSIFDGVGYLHGHTYPNSSLLGTLILVGHHHPVISLYDGVGIALRSACYVLGELSDDINSDKNLEGLEDIHTRVLLVPAFNECVGYGIERTFRRPFSPISRCIIQETAECILLDGTYIGDVKSLIQHDCDICA